MGGVADIGRLLAETQGREAAIGATALSGARGNAQPGLQVRLKSPTDRW
jgi:hypothetical protein